MFISSQWQAIAEVADENLRVVNWETFKSLSAEWTAAWGETPRDQPSGETDVGGWPISGCYTTKNGRVVGSYGPTFSENWMAFPDGNVVQWGNID
jgi:hypothetical protein